MTTKQELAELVKHGVDHATKILVEERQKELMPMFHLVGPPGGRGDAVVGTPWNGDFEKQLAVAKVKQISHDMDAQACMFTTEAWMVKLKPEKPLSSWHAARAAEQFRHIIPSQSPDRIECVVIIAINKAGDSEAATLQIIRDKPGGRIISLVPETESPGAYESWMFKGMFKDAEA